MNEPSRSVEPYPLLCQPVFKEKIWGGRKLRDWLPDAPDSDTLGEAWLIADLVEGASTIANGPLAGQTLSRARELWGDRLNGDAWSDADERFPLLVKIIDAREKLSVQVHPANDDCREKFAGKGYHGKDESWILLESEDDGAVYFGFEPGVDLERFDRALEAGEVESTLRRLPTRAGEALRVAPGTVHAMLKGVLILEIQQPSDTTFRLYDYDRRGADGQPRPLHIEESRQVMRFDTPDQPKIDAPWRDMRGGRHCLLIDAPAYRIERAEVEAPLDLPACPGSARALIVTDGEGTLAAAGCAAIDLRPGSAVALPAALAGATLQPTTDRLAFTLAGAGGQRLL